MVALLLQVTGHPELCHSARLLVSELVTNVNLHTASPAVRLEAVVRGDRVRVAVYDDESGGTPTPRASSRTGESGRGLLLVEAIAQDWGVGLGDAGGTGGVGRKHVWFELRGSGAAVLR